MESDATTGKISEITFTKNDKTITIHSRIKTFKVEKGVEYMILENGEEIRLDHLILFNDSPVT